MAPGPLLTYTIVKTMQTRRLGFLVGFWVIGGHAALEFLLIVALLVGLSPLLKSPLTIRILGIAGGLVLVFLGGSLVRNVLGGRLPDVFEQSKGSKNDQKKISNPFFGGVLVSMSNPYWWIWWASIGFAFMLQHKISLGNWPLLLAFFVGHEAGDLAWYSLVSALVYFGRRKIQGKLYHLVLAICGIFMVGFGIYLGASVFMKEM